MTFDEFLTFRDVVIRDESHRKIVNLFYPYLFSVSGDPAKLPGLVGSILKIDLSAAGTKTACFNNSGTADPAVFPADFTVLFDNDVSVDFYGSLPKTSCIPSQPGRYAVFILGDSLDGVVSFRDTNCVIIGGNV